MLAAIVTLALAACGGSSGPAGNGVERKSPDGIVTAAMNAVGSARSVHVAGNVMNSGSRITLDLNLVSGKGGQGSMAQNGLSFQVVTVGDEVYINGTIAFWQRFAGSAAAQLLWGKWIKAPAGGQLATLTMLGCARRGRRRRTHYGPRLTRARRACPRSARGDRAGVPTTGG
jgi:hypothetical protein